MVDALSNKLTLMIKMNVKDVDDEKAEIINYGLICFLSFITKTIIILLVSYLLGILDLTVIAIVSLGFYRAFAGGAHANSHMICLFTSFIIFLGPVYLGKFIFSLFSNIEILYLFIFILNCVIIYYYAPADVEQKPILSKNLRERLRMQSAFSMSLVIVLALTIIKNHTISNVLVATTLVESITMIPLFYKLIGCKYGCRQGSVPDIKQL